MQQGPPRLHAVGPLSSEDQRTFDLSTHRKIIRACLHNCLPPDVSQQLGCRSLSRNLRLSCPFMLKQERRVTPESMKRTMHCLTRYSRLSLNSAKFRSFLPRTVTNPSPLSLPFTHELIPSPPLTTMVPWSDLSLLVRTELLQVARMAVLQ